MNGRAKCINEDCKAYNVEKSVTVGILMGYGTGSGRVICPACGALTKTIQTEAPSSYGRGGSRSSGRKAPTDGPRSGESQGASRTGGRVVGHSGTGVFTSRRQRSCCTHAYNLGRHEASRSSAGALDPCPAADDLRRWHPQILADKGRVVDRNCINVLVNQIHLAHGGKGEALAVSSPYVPNPRCWRPRGNS